MNMFARFDENPAMTLQVIKKTKRYGRTDARTDNVKTVYPTTNKVCGGYKDNISLMLYGYKSGLMEKCTVKPVLSKRPRDNLKLLA